MYIATAAHFRFVGRNIAEYTPNFVKFIPQYVVDGEISDFYASYCNNDYKQVIEHTCIAVVRATNPFAFDLFVCF